MNWLRWIRPGLVATILVALIAFYFRVGVIEQDLADRVTEQLAADGQAWATVTVSARDVTLAGTAPSIDSQDQAERAARKVDGVRGVVDASGLLPVASPYIWTARRDGSTVVLSGSVPSEGARAQVMASARRALPEGEIRDAMTLARGAPVSFGAATTFGLVRLANLAQGIVTLTDATLAISGVADSAAAYKTALAAIGSEVPPSMSVGPVDIQPARADPFVWSANYDGKSVTVVGYVPNEVVDETLTATIKATLPGVPVLDTVATASGAPPGFAEAASFAVGALKNLSQGGVTLDGLHLDVSGAAKTVDDYEALLTVLSSTLPDGMTVVSSAITPAPVSPYGWEGEKANGTVVLTGYVPTAAGLDDVNATARIVFAGSNVQMRVRVAAGAPRMDWLGAIKFAMGELAKLDHGRVSVSDNNYTVEGVALSPEAYMSIRDVNGKTLPASLNLAAGDVAPPVVSPYRFHAARRGAGIVISGDVPDEATRDAIFADAHAKFGATGVGGDLVFASGAPDNYVEAVSDALQGLSRLAGGYIDVAGTAITIAGVAYEPSAVEEIGDGLTAALPAGYTITANSVTNGQPGQPVAAEGCRDLIQAVLQTGHIEFDGNKAEIAADSIGLLDRASAAVERCTGVTIEVGAHSDSEGSTSRNRDLTQARAEAIVDYMVGAGVRRETLVPVGYGETKPIADNDTDAGRAANRRIEFTVTLPGGG